MTTDEKIDLGIFLGLILMLAAFLLQMTGCENNSEGTRCQERATVLGMSDATYIWPGCYARKEKRWFVISTAMDGRITTTEVEMK